jgi:hypothetical protein
VIETVARTAPVKQQAESGEKKLSAELFRQLAASLTEAFILLFFLQLFTQQLFVRLSPYLFEAGPSSTVTAWSFLVGALSTDSAALIGIGALLMDGFVFLRFANRGLALAGAILVLTGAIVGFMDTARVLFGSTGLSFQGLTLWELFTRILLFGVAALGTILAVASSKNPSSSATLPRLMCLIKDSSISSVLLIVPAYLLMGSIGYVGVGAVAAVYNVSINLMGICVVSSAIYSALRLNRRTFAISILGGAMLSIIVGYMLYANYFISRIFEMTWQTSFGTPIPPTESTVYSFFLGFLFTAGVWVPLARKKFSEALPTLGLVAFLSSVFLIDSLTLYFEAATLGFIVFVTTRIVGAETQPNTVLGVGG